MSCACRELIRTWLRRLGWGRQTEPAEPLAEEDWSLTSGKVTYREDGHVADAHGFEYVRYRLSDPSGNQRTGYCRVIPTTYLFTCPDCGGMVGGVDAVRVRPGGTGPDPTAFACEACGRRERYDFGIPRVTYQEGTLTFEEPRGLQPLCPRGGAHRWRLTESHIEQIIPPDASPDHGGFHPTRKRRRRTWVCDACGQTRHDVTEV